MAETKKLSVSLPQGTLGRLYEPIMAVEDLKNVTLNKPLNEIFGELESHYGVKFEVKQKLVNEIKTSETVEKRIQNLAKVLTKFATAAIIQKKLYLNVPEGEFGKQLKVITKAWSENIISKVHDLPELRKRKLLSDRKCRLKKYIVKCPVCNSKDLEKDLKALTVKCRKCGWARTLDGSGMRTVPRKPKQKSKSG